MQDAGARAFTLHARTRTQMYTGHARWEEIADVPGIGPKTALAIKAALDASAPGEAVNMATGEIESG